MPGLHSARLEGSFPPYPPQRARAARDTGPRAPTHFRSCDSRRQDSGPRGLCSVWSGGVWSTWERPEGTWKQVGAGAREPCGWDRRELRPREERLGAHSGSPAFKTCA